MMDACANIENGYLFLMVIPVSFENAECGMWDDVY